MKKVFYACLFSSFLLNIFVCGKSFAAGAGGFHIEMDDARALSMGGAFVGVADSAAAVFFNPAGMTQIRQPEVSAGVGLIQPKEHAQSDGGEKTKMQQDSFLIPSLFFVTPVSDKIALGAGVNSSWGLTTDWAQNYFGRFVATHTSMQNEDYILAAAYKVTDQFSLGIGATIDNSTFEQQRKLNQFPFSTSDANFKLKGDDTAAGYQISGLYKLNDRHQFGIQYSSAISHTYRGKVHLDGLDPTVQGIFGFSGTGASYETDVESKLMLPQSVDLGYSFKATEKLTLNADVLWMDWSSVKEEALSYPNETAASGHLGILQGGFPANYDWHSAFSLGLGAEYKASDRLRLRAGYYFHQSPVPQDTWTSAIPDANSHSIATGFGYDVTKSLTVDFTYSAMFYDTRSIKNQVGDSVNGSIDGKYSQWTNMAMATATYKF